MRCLNEAGGPPPTLTSPIGQEPEYRPGHPPRRQGRDQGGHAGRERLAGTQVGEHSPGARLQAASLTALGQERVAA